MEKLDALIATGVGIVWSPFLVFLLVGTGLFLTIAMGFPQIRGFMHAIQVVRGKYSDPDAPGEISHFEALATALSATVGLGNIAGVAVAIKMGGPGATFWMIVTGLLGMATKYSECSLAIMHRTIDPDGKVQGGPMYYIKRGLFSGNTKLQKLISSPLAMFFAFACMCATFGAGNMFQSNQVASILNDKFQISTILTGAVLAVLTAVVILGGIKRIGSVTSKLVPFMGGLYVLGALAVIFMNFEKVPSMFAQIFGDAFSGTAAAGGFTGIAVREVIMQGVKRGCFSNEAGLGSSPIAHSAASTSEPIREGIVALLEPFVDTVVICTLTALVILLSGQWMTPGLEGVNLTAASFDSVLPGFGSIFVPIAVFLFAYSTLLSWSYYGEQAVDYLTGGKGNKKLIICYKLFYCFLAFLGANASLQMVLNFSDMMLGLMVFPNLIAVIFMIPKLRAETKRYFKKYVNV